MAFFLGGGGSGCTPGNLAPTVISKSAPMLGTCQKALMLFGWERNSTAGCGRGLVYHPQHSGFELLAQDL